MSVMRTPPPIYDDNDDGENKPLAIISAFLLAVVLCVAIIGLAWYSSGLARGHEPPRTPVIPPRPEAKTDAKTEAEPRVKVISLYTDEGDIKPYGLADAAANTKAMGKEHPRIIMHGHYLVYDPEVNWYRFVGTNYKAYWLPLGMEQEDKDGKIEKHEMRLLLPARYDEKANKFQYLDSNTGKWSGTEPPGAERYKGPILDAEKRNKEENAT